MVFEQHVLTHVRKCISGSCSLHKCAAQRWALVLMLLTINLLFVMCLITHRALSLNRNASTSFSLAPVDVLVLSKSTNTALPLLLLVSATTACSITVPSLAIVVVVLVVAAAAVDCVFIAYASKFVSLIMLNPVLPSAPLLYKMSLSARLQSNDQKSDVTCLLCCHVTYSLVL
jgi:hypothetical protein